jgi:hypothetical protein
MLSPCFLDSVQNNTWRPPPNPHSRAQWARTKNAQNYNLNAPNINALDHHLRGTVDIQMPNRQHNSIPDYPGIPWTLASSLCRQPANYFESMDHDTPFIERIQPVATSHPLHSCVAEVRPKTCFGLWLVFHQERWSSLQSLATGQNEAI